MKPPKPKPLRNADIRILPAVVGVGAILFVLKASGLAFGASAATAPQSPDTQVPAAAAPAAAQGPAAPAAPRAQSTTPLAATPVPPPAAPKTPAPGAPLPNAAPDPLAAINSALPNPAGKPTLAQSENRAPPTDTLQTDLAATGISPAEMDVLTALADRRDALEERQRELDTKANVLAAAEKRVDDKIAQLKALQTQIEALLGQRDTKETEQLDGLVRIYTAMKPKDAARIFSSLNDDVRIGVAGRMKADAMAGIMSALPADIAQKMTVELASRYKMPAQAAAAAAAVTAAPAAQPAAIPAANASAAPAATQPAPAAARPATPSGG